MIKIDLSAKLISPNPNLCRTSIRMLYLWCIGNYLAILEIKRNYTDSTGITQIIPSQYIYQFAFEWKHYVYYKIMKLFYDSVLVYTYFYQIRVVLIVFKIKKTKNRISDSQSTCLYILFCTTINSSQEKIVPAQRKRYNSCKKLHNPSPIPLCYRSIL